MTTPVTILDSDLYDGPHRNDSPAQNTARALLDWARTPAPDAQDSARLDELAQIKDEKRLVSIELPSNPHDPVSPPATVDFTIDEITASIDSARLYLDHDPDCLTIELHPTHRLVQLAQRFADGNLS